MRWKVKNTSCRLTRQNDISVHLVESDGRDESKRAQRPRRESIKSREVDRTFAVDEPPHRQARQR